MKNRITAIILCAALLLASAVTLTGCGTVLPAGAADLGIHAAEFLIIRYSVHICQFIWKEIFLRWKSRKTLLS